MSPTGKGRAEPRPAAPQAEVSSRQSAKPQVHGGAEAQEGAFLRVWRHLSPEMLSFILPASFQSRGKTKPSDNRIFLLLQHQVLRDNLP